MPSGSVSHWRQRVWHRHLFSLGAHVLHIGHILDWTCDVSVFSVQFGRIIALYDNDISLIMTQNFVD